MLTLINDFLSGAASNSLARALTWVEIANGAGNAALGPLAAETLMNEGFAVRYGANPAGAYTRTTLIDYTTSAKGSPLKRLQSVLHLADAQVLAEPNANSPVQFRVILGSDYNPCPRLDWMDTSAAESGN
jgi:hypothetical protein